MKMTKRYLSVLLVLLLFAALMMPALAVSEKPRLVDQAHLLNAAEQSELLAKLDEISERQRVDIAVVTAETMDGKTPMDYADDWYDSNGYGFGSGYDGVLLLVSMEDRDWWISTSGYGMTAVNDAGITYISDQFLPDMRDGNYAQAFTTFAELCDEFVRQAKNGQPYDSGHMPKEPFNYGFWLLAAMVIGLIIALKAAGSMKKKLKSVRLQAAAAGYVKTNSMHITESRDLFLYNTVTRTAKSKSRSSSGSSSAHTSSSGRSHGGGGGKF